MSRVWYISHPAVIVAPDVPVPRWSLKPEGRAQMATFATRPELVAITSIWSSDEVKAIEAAAILATQLGLTPRLADHAHENDRSATGFIPPADFERAADAFFAHPSESFRGWERAIDAQTRIVAVWHTILAEAPAGDIAIVGHGGVGTLLYCHLAGLAIDRRHDQPAQGCHWLADRATGQPQHGWRSLAA